MKYQIREEPFGYTLYNYETLTHKFYKNLPQKKGILLRAKRTDFRQDIIYSPIRIYYELTLACNLRCRFCFNNSGIPRNNELTTKEVIKSLEHLRENNVFDVRFTGGEFTCRPDWYEILKKAKELGFAVSCNTNGHFGKQTAEKLASLKLDQICFSIDGTEEHHNQNRGKGNYQETLSNLERLSKLGTTLRINTLLSRLTINDLEAVVKLASKYTNEINLFPVRFIGRGTNLESDYSITMEQFYQLGLKAKKLKKEYPALNLLTFAKATRRTSINKKEKKSFGLKVGTTSGITTFNVTSNGGLWAGGYVPYIDPTLCLGNIKNDNIFEVWQRNKTLEAIRNQGKRLKEFCYQCPKYGNKCPGTILELEQYRQLHPESRNYYCVHGKGKPLLDRVTKSLPYRNNVAALVRKEKKFLLVQLHEWEKNFWKLPQGGADNGERKDVALFRELKEELGTIDFRIIKRFPFTHRYDWDKTSQRLARFQWRGQKQTFFLVDFSGNGIRPDPAEIRNYCWATKEELLEKIDIKHPLFKGYKKTIEKCLKNLSL